ncbi:Protein DD3-3 [Symbiodinium microadriaticum]|uniref:Protein DD3-3 n=1 Tax=Symbiodinium microadriaticum TaxID=2951 RepID=A0A1Q9CZH7_SYMMI|nr:Protein DD3-3 [Symbiodinium microadriaticum]
MAVLALAVLLSFGHLVQGDMYLNSPRGSNNKLREQSNNVQNANRLFDSQNNAASGYQIGDDCKPACKDENNNYDVTKEGATKGTMKFYQGSELYIDWFVQHGCGVGHPNLRCQITLQYMTESDNPNLRDGTDQDSAGGDDEDPTEEETAEVARGYHEPLEYYQACYERERNKGLFTSDQQIEENGGATSTRQNPNGNGRRRGNHRHGLECPEERDYYPYWHPTPWHDIAIFTQEPQERCEYYRAESQNVKEKGRCSINQYNNPDACTGNGGEPRPQRWTLEPAFNEPPPECWGGIASRDNHNGNVRNGHPDYYLWKIPEHIKGRVVLRIRYNITTDDFTLGSLANPTEEGTSLSGIKADPFFMDRSFNDPNPNNRRYGRTFEDRTHTFLVMERPADVPADRRIVNYNVRGRRGNIVQVYPSVEYDFVPQDLVVEQGTLLHFQWTGSDANNNGHLGDERRGKDAGCRCSRGNAGNGRAGTDRSNLVQVKSRSETVPLPIDQHTLLFDASANPNDPEGRRLVDKFAFLDQDSIVTCDPETNDQNSETNCKQLNGASAYFDGGLVEMKRVGDHHIASTRNNDFTNRSHKASIKVTGLQLELYENIALGVGAFCGLILVIYVIAAIYACRRPGSWLFSRRYRPRLLNLFLSRRAMDSLVEERRQIVAQQRREWAKKANAHAVDEEGAADSADVALPEETLTWFQAINRCFRRCGIGEQRLTTLMYAVLNILVFVIGFLSNLRGGFHESWAYPMAKGGGYSMDLNFAMLILPTLKSLQTTMRRVSSSREWIPIDDPIAFHVVIASYTMLSAAIHIAGHCVHIYLIKTAPTIQLDPLELWNLSAEEKASGMTLLQQLLNFQNRCAALTGIILTFLMLAILLTAVPCARRGTNCVTRRLGGFNLFWRVHMTWKFIYVLLLLHAPQRLWIWFFFPAIFVLVDRLLLSNHQALNLALKSVKLLPRDVIGLTFEVPQGFAYQAGQYILLGWKGEWHPFTLTSAPEENCISVHIRSPNNLDWCSALRRRLTEEAPAQAAGREPTRAKAPMLLEYSKHVLPNSQVVYNMPKVSPNGAKEVEGDESKAKLEGPRLLGRSPSGKLVQPPARSGETLISNAAPGMLPDESVVLQVTGPFGAPAQKVWGFDVLMVVGAGIGVTPFASILRSVQLRAKQRETIMNAATRPSNWRSVMANSTGNAPVEDPRAGLEKLVDDLVVVPKKIYFYWICRGQEEFDWFCDLLTAAAEGPAMGIVEITLFLTGEIELSQVKKLPCAAGQFFGRPNWGRIFKQNREKHQGEHIGVFLCGSPVIGEQLSQQSIKNSDLVGTPGGTRFSFFKEHF